MSDQLHATRRRVLAGALLGAGALLALALPNAQAAPERVLILSTTVTNGALSLEAKAATSRGYAVDVVSPTQWSAMSATQFAGYRALVLGDPTCSSSPTTVAAAAGNAEVWGGVVDGNVVVNGTDPVFHASSGGAALTDKSMAFALDAPGKTGAYVSLSCYYHGAAAGTLVPALAGLSDDGPDFRVTNVGCFNDAHIVATHPALAGLTDANLSNWSCSVHEAFTHWPSDFTVLAIAEGLGSYLAPDGTRGTPYILARGEGLSASSISLTPGASTVPLPGSHAMSALISVGGAPQSGRTVTFDVLSGPHAGDTGSSVTGADGTAPFSLTGTTPGTDVVRASFVDGRGVVQESNTATVTWAPPANSAPEADAGDGATVPEGGTVPLSGSGTDPDGDALTAAWDLDGDGVFETSGLTATFSAAGLDGPSSSTATLRVCDDDAACDTDSTTVDITNVAPTVSAGPDVTVFRGEDATLTGSASDPAAGLDAPYAWTFGSSSGSAPDGAPLTHTVSHALPGSYAHELAVTDDDGATGRDSATVLVLNRTPDCTGAAASTPVLWPPNHQMVGVSVVGLTDADGDAVTTTITGIRQDERVDGTASGRTGPDGAGVGTSRAEVRAERDGTPKAPGDGRVYTIAFTADDGFGGTCSGTVTVGVPHDQRGAAAVDGGPLHDSTTV